MPIVSFHLVSNTDLLVVKSFSSLVDCVKYIRLNINDARSYFVDQIDDGEIVDTCSAYYLLENYKDLNKLPELLKDC